MICLLFSGGLRNLLDIREIGANGDNMGDSFDGDTNAGFSNSSFSY